MPRSTIPFTVNPSYTFKKPHKSPARSSRNDEIIEDEKCLAQNASQPEDSDQDFRKSLLTPLFVLNIFYFAVLVIRWNYFVSSFNAWMTSKAQEQTSNCTTVVETVSSYTNIFGTIQMMEAFCLAPFVGLVIDLSGMILKRTNPNIKDDELRLKQTMSSMVICILLGVISALMPLVDLMGLQVVTIIAACLFRTFMVGTTATFLSLCFPSEHFGKLYGITRTIGGISTFLAVPIFKLVTSLGNRYDLGNIFFAIVIVTTLIHPIYIWRSTRQKKTTS